MKILCTNRIQAILLLTGLAASLPALAHPGDAGNRDRAPTLPDPNVIPPMFADQVKDGYSGETLAVVAQAGHIHNERADGSKEQWPPAEVWYLATIKPVNQAETKWRYCVAPRLEVPGDTKWAPVVNVQLFGSREPKQKVSQLASVMSNKALHAGASIELASSNDWCVVRSRGEADMPPVLYLVTQHGSATVVFPELSRSSFVPRMEDAPKVIPSNLPQPLPTSPIRSGEVSASQPPSRR